MTNETLRERIARALAAWYSSDDDDRHWERHTGAAEIALTALGLDDLDAAVERAAVPLLPYTRIPDQVARGVLEAALTATEGTDDA